ncbi:MAG: AI-2E family transporter, partial [Microlunatus sp.]|nr:AI-2E family transporter [Microlunatus sp.]
MTSTRTGDDGLELGREPSREAGRGGLLHRHPQPRSLQRAAAPASLVIAAAWCWRILVVAVTVLGLILLAARFYLPVLPFIFALLLAALLHPLHVGMRQLRLPRALATWATVMVALLVIAGVGWFVWTRAASSYTQLIAQVDGLASQLRGYLGQVSGSNTMQLAQLQNSAVSW